LELESITPEEIPRKVKEINIDTLEISEKDVSTYYKLPKIQHKDPFDRLLIWQAINYNITLISKDKEIEEYKTFGLKLLIG